MRVALCQAANLSVKLHDFMAGSCCFLSEAELDLQIIQWAMATSSGSMSRQTDFCRMWASVFWKVAFFRFKNSDFICNASKFQHVSYFAAVCMCPCVHVCVCVCLSVFALCFPRNIFWVVKKKTNKKKRSQAKQSQQ